MGKKFTKGFYNMRYERVFIGFPKLENSQTQFYSNVSIPTGKLNAFIHQVCGAISSAQYNSHSLLTILV